MTGPYPDKGARLLISAAVMLSTIMVMLDTTIANVALPQIQSSVQASQEQIVWVLTSYLIAAAIMTPLSGWLAERFGRKRVMAMSVAGFTIASMGCGIVTGMNELVVFRLIQGACGAGLVPLSMATLLDINPPEDHGPAMALYGLGSMVGPLLGPTLGGYLTETMSWRWIFFINVPFGIMAFLGISAFMSESRRARPPRFDLMGFAALSIFLGTFQLMLDRGQQLDWFSSWEICIEAAIAALFAYISLVHMFTTRDPFVRPGLFADRNYLFGSLVSMLLGVFVFASVPLITTMIQKVLGYPVLLTGLVSAPRGIGTTLAMLLVGRMIGRVDARILLVSGLTICGIGFFMYSKMALIMNQQTILIAGFIQGFGSGLLFVPLSFLVFSTLDPRYRNEGTSIFALTRNLGAAIGISLLQAMTIRNGATVESRLVETVRPDNPVLEMRVPGFDFDTPQSVAAMMQEIGRQASMIAYLDAYWLLFILTLCMIPVCLLMKPPEKYVPGDPVPVLE